MEMSQNNQFPTLASRFHSFLCAFSALDPPHQHQRRATDQKTVTQLGSGDCCTATKIEMVCVLAWLMLVYAVSSTQIFAGRPFVLLRHPPLEIFARTSRFSGQKNMAFVDPAERSGRPNPGSHGQFPMSASLRGSGPSPPATEAVERLSASRMPPNELNERRWTTLPPGLPGTTHFVIPVTSMDAPVLPVRGASAPTRADSPSAGYLGSATEWTLQVENQTLQLAIHCRQGDADAVEAMLRSGVDTKASCP